MSTDRTTEKQAEQIRRSAGLVDDEPAEKPRRRRVETGDRSGQRKKKPTATQTQAARMLGRTSAS